MLLKKSFQAFKMSIGPYSHIDYLSLSLFVNSFVGITIINPTPRDIHPALPPSPTHKLTLLTRLKLGAVKILL